MSKDEIQGSSDTDSPDAEMAIRWLLYGVEA